MKVAWKLLHPNMTLEALGLIPEMLDDADPRSAREQIDANYQHGGGWHSQRNAELGAGNVLEFPEDPPLRPLAEARLRDQLIVFYRHSWVAIVAPDRSFDVARID